MATLSSSKAGFSFSWSPVSHPAWAPPAAPRLAYRAALGPATPKRPAPRLWPAASFEFRAPLAPPDGVSPAAFPPEMFFPLCLTVPALPGDLTSTYRLPPPDPMPDRRLSRSPPPEPSPPPPPERGGDRLSPLPCPERLSLKHSSERNNWWKMKNPLQSFWVP
ncbi:formin-like protein 5 [Dendrobium catenatum]|uniref:formin-like protein 5 n=1 Tax=Dendrobium catenatum TaxID=906689 RepID=UPI0010A07A2C|nr:formin-like protein 5 [Dendrobium catenatum]